MVTSAFSSLPPTNIVPFAVPIIMVGWGLVMTLMCLVNSFQSLVVYVNRTLGIINPQLTVRHSGDRARLFLGLTEAGLFPGVTYYISLWYPRSEQSKRIAIFFSAATVAGMG
jgi:MFS family permease